MAGTKNGWGGRRVGPGRPEGVGTHGAEARIHRVAIMLNLSDLKLLQQRARRNNLRVATVAAQIIQRSVRASG